MVGQGGVGFGSGRGLRAPAAAAAFLFVLAGSPREARADAYKDERLGFSLNYPGRWKQMPISTDERWKVAQWQNPRVYEDADPKTNGWTHHQPKLEVVIIPNSAAEQRGAEVREQGDRVIVTKQAPWRDIKEYMDKTTQDERLGGYFFSKEEETKVGAMKVMVYEITVDKFTNSWNNSPRKIYGWAFYAEDAIYGLVGDALVKFEDKVKPELDAAFRSFKIFPRKGTLPGAEVTGEEDAEVIVKKDPSKEHVTDDELRKRRVSAFNRQLGKIKETLAEGWRIKESENFTAVTHCDDRFTKEVLDHAEALREWLDKNFGFVGTGYAGKVILRICADENERQAMYDTMKWTETRCEVVTGQDKNGWFENRLQDLNRGVYQIWMTDKNRDLYWALPPWIDWGLASVVSCARSKGKKITDFKADTWDKVQIDTLRRGEKLLPARRFFSLDMESLWQDFENHRQSEFFVRWLLVGSAQRNAKYKNLLSDYVKNLAILLDEVRDAEGAAKGVEEPKNEQEESELRRKRNEAWRSAQGEVLRKLLEKTFPGWEDKDWAQFNAAYWKELGA